MTPSTDDAFETRVSALLDRRAERLEVDPGIRRLPVRRRLEVDQSSLRRWLPAAAALLLVIGGAAVALRGGGVSPADSAAPLVMAAAGVPAGAEAPAADLIVWLEPGATDAQIDAVAAELARAVAAGQLTHFRHVDRVATWAEFEAYYADEPTIVDSVLPEQLPTRFEVMLAAGGAPDLSAVEALPAVREIGESFDAEG